MSFHWKRFYRCYGNEGIYYIWIIGIIIITNMFLINLKKFNSIIKWISPNLKKEKKKKKAIQ